MEFDFAPILITFGLKSYTTDYLGDNCLWTYTNHHTMLYETRLTKNIARCGMNIRDKIDDAQDWTDIEKDIKYDGLNFWFAKPQCYFEEEMNSNQ